MKGIWELINEVINKRKVQHTLQHTTVAVMNKANKLSVDIKKTDYIVFKSRQKVINFYDVTPIRFGGVYLDENLYRKVVQSVGILYRSLVFLSQSSYKEVTLA